MEKDGVRDLHRHQPHHPKKGIKYQIDNVIFGAKFTGRPIHPTLTAD
jgi:hypothetical protein